MSIEIPKPGPRKPAETKNEPQVKKPYVRKDNLTQRPFVNPALISLREGMQRNIHIKKK